MAPYDPKTFLEQLAPHILAELKPPEDLKKFTRNSDVVGHYVEASVRQLVRRYLAPIRVCTGAVIDQAQSPGSEKIPQLDTIAWIPGDANKIKGQKLRGVSVLHGHLGGQKQQVPPLRRR